MFAEWPRANNEVCFRLDGGGGEKRFPGGDGARVKTVGHPRFGRKESLTVSYCLEKHLH